MQTTDVSAEEAERRLGNIRFASDWGLLGTSYERLEGYIEAGDEMGAAEETFHLYDLCVGYLADQ